MAKMELEPRSPENHNQFFPLVTSLALTPDLQNKHAKQTNKQKTLPLAFLGVAKYPVICIYYMY